MYAEDSLFTLSAAGQAGVLAITMGLSLGLLWAVYRLTRGRPVAVRLVVPILLFVLFVSLSPQVYYLYYRRIFEGLPQQWVTRWPDPGGLLALVAFQAKASLSDHGKGLLFWAMICVSLAPLARRR